MNCKTVNKAIKTVKTNCKTVNCKTCIQICNNLKPVKRTEWLVKERNKFHNYETEKISRKANDAAEYIELFGSFTRDWTTHLMLFSECPPIYASCIMISGERTEQLDIFCRVTGFTSDFHPLQSSADICVRHDDLG